MQLAFDQAKIAESILEVPVGAVIVLNNQCIAAAYNTRETTQNSLGHAELNVIKKASESLNSWRLIDCELYVTLGPCPMCLAACQQARIKKLVYGAKDMKGGAVCLGYHLNEDARTNHQFSVIYEPMEECSEILKNFFKKVREK